MLDMIGPERSQEAAAAAAEQKSTKRIAELEAMLVAIKGEKVRANTGMHGPAGPNHPARTGLAVSGHV